MYSSERDTQQSAVAPAAGPAPGAADAAHRPGTPDAAGVASGSRREARGLVQLWLTGVICFAVILFLLVQARFLLISLVVAIILFSLTSDVIRWVGGWRLGRLRVPPLAASLAALGIIASVLLALAALVVSQANTIVMLILQYTDPASQALATLFGWMGEDVEVAVLNSIRQFDVAGNLRTLAGQAGNLLSAVVLIILFVGFMFAERIWFSTKLTNLFDDGARAARVERIIGSIIHRVNRYLLVKTLISLMTGALTYAVLWLADNDLALSVGFLTFLLNYIPNVGSIVAVICAALVVYVQTADPVTTLAITSALTAIQFGVGLVLDPLLLGRALRLSSFGILISLAFWAAVWGIPGMFLAVPIMVAAMIVCSHIPSLRPVAVLLSREGLPDTDLHPEVSSGTEPIPQPAAGTARSSR
jgi:AI-2 transport protein TqsA